MILLPLNPGTYAGRKFTVRYQTNGYYEIEPSEQGFSMKYVPLEVPVEKSFEDEIWESGWKPRSLSARLRAKS